MAGTAPHVTSAQRVVIAGNPDQALISTSLVERQNFDDADEHAALHSVNKCILEEGREPSRGRVTALRALQLCARASLVAYHTRDGGGHHRSAWSLDELVERAAD